MQVMKQPVTLESFKRWEALRILLLSDKLWMIIYVTLLILLNTFKVIVRIKLHVHGVKLMASIGDEGINGRLGSTK